MFFAQKNQGPLYATLRFSNLPLGSWNLLELPSRIRVQKFMSKGVQSKNEGQAELESHHFPDIPPAETTQNKSSADTTSRH